MVSRISSAKPTTVKPPSEKPVKVSASSNDPSQHVKVAGNIISINGTASNNGIIQSRVNVTVDGKEITVPLFGGESPGKTAEAISKALPKGYKGTVRMLNGTATLSISKSPAKPEKPTGGVSQATVDKMNKALAAWQKTHTWKNGQLPVGVRFEQVLLHRDNYPDGFTTTAYIPAGALSPSAPKTDPNKAKEFYVVRQGGIAGMTQYLGPIPLK